MTAWLFTIVILTLTPEGPKFVNVNAAIVPDEAECRELIRRVAAAKTDLLVFTRCVPIK